MTDGGTIEVAADGWCSQAAHRPSPNFDLRPPGMPIDLLVIHNISLPPGQFGGPFIADLFGNCLDYDAHPYFDQLRALRVSAHFLIQRSGVLMQFVSANDRAWHCGTSCFGGRNNCNDFSIGIELEGTDFQPFTTTQYQVLVSLTHALASRYPLTDVAGHADIAAGRKTDPGPCFEWRKYRQLYKKHLPLALTSSALHFPPPA